MKKAASFKANLALEAHNKLEEYKVFKLKFSENDEEKSSHSIYVKKYRSEKKSANKPAGKTIVALNIPPYADEKSLSRVFGSSFGEVEHVILIDDYANEHKTKYQLPSKFFKHKLPFKFLIAFIVFKKSSPVDQIFTQKNVSLPPLSTEEQPLLTGVAKWMAEYNDRSIDTVEMQKEIDDYMVHYDRVKRAEEMNGENEADDDGWVTVGKKGQNAGFKQNEAVVNKLVQKVDTQKKRAKEMLKSNYKRASGMYSFEMREGKKRELMELRKKFQDDRIRLQSMKQNRRFKPY